MIKLRHIVALGVLYSLASTPVIVAQSDSKQPSPPESITSSKSAERYDDLVIEMISVKREVETGQATITAYFCNLRPAEVYAAINWGAPVGMKEIGYITPGEVKTVTLTCKLEEIPWNRPVEAQVYNMEIHKLETTDTAALHHESATTLAIVFEQDAFKQGNKEYGSAVRRVRQLVDRHNDKHAKNDKAASIRLAHFEVFDPEQDDAPSLSENQADYDIVFVVGRGELHNIWTDEGSKAFANRLKASLQDG